MNAAMSNKKCLSSEDKKKIKGTEEKNSTGKKLVQARLPFKVLSTSTTSTASSSSSAPDDTTKNTESTRKRKLQFEDDTTDKIESKQICIDVKENSPSVNKVPSSPVKNVIEIETSDDDKDNCNSGSSSVENSSLINKTDSASKVNNNDPHSSKLSKKSNSDGGKFKLKFKLPFGNAKKKRERKTRINSKQRNKSNDDSDIEESVLHPNKKLKKDDLIKKTDSKNGITKDTNNVIELITDDEEPMDDSDVSSVDYNQKQDEIDQHDVNNLKEGSDKETEPNDVQTKTASNDKEDLKKVDCEEQDKKESDELKAIKAEEPTACIKTPEMKIPEERCSKSDSHENDDHNLPSTSGIQQYKTNEDFEMTKNASVRLNRTKFRNLLDLHIIKSDWNVEEDETNPENLCLSMSSSSDNDGDAVLIVRKDEEAENTENDSSFCEVNNSLNGEANSDKNTKNKNDTESTLISSKDKSSAKLTPARIKKLQEMEKRREERLKAKEEKERKIQEEKKKREEKELQKKKEKEEKEEQKRREKEEKDEQKRKEKEEKEKKRLAEIEMKNEERKQREEERRRKEELKEEEKRKREEERRKKEQEKEEAENKKKRAAEAFTRFFVTQKPPPQKEIDEDHTSVDSDNSTICIFMPFQIRDHMKLAPLIRRSIDTESKENLDKILAQTDEQEFSKENLYLNMLKSGKYIPGRDGRTYAKDDDAMSDVVIVEDELEDAGQSIDDTIKPQKYKAKFLYFHENQRPPYYGTWRKKSKTITARRPIVTDNTHFDYEIDSDDEWEEEEPGESLHGSDDEKDKESEDDYEVDNEFFVPHGHLSEEEMQNEDEEDNSPEIQKVKLKLMQQEFAQEMKKKTEKIKPRLIGIIWQDENGNKPDTCPDVIWSSLNKRAMIFATPPIMNNFEKQQKSETETGSLSLQDQQKAKVKLSGDLVKDLIRLIHGNKHNKEFLITEFQAFVAKKNEQNSEPKIEYSKALIRKKIDKIAEWKIHQEHEKSKKTLCWTVAPEFLKKYELEHLNFQNDWSYILEPKKRPKLDKSKDEIATTIIKPQQTQTFEVTNQNKEEKKLLPTITKFTKVLTKEEKEMQLKNGITTVQNDVLLSSKNNDNKEQQERHQQTNIVEDQKINSLPLKPPLTEQSDSTVVKKRVPLLLSVPRGQQISQTCKDRLISDFLKKKNQDNSDKEENSNLTENNQKTIKNLDTTTPMNIDDTDVIVLK